MSMFGALNRFISRLDAEPQEKSSNVRRGACGFQVLRNENAEVPIEPWYDIVIGINGRQIVSSGVKLFDIQSDQDRIIPMHIFSLKRSRTALEHR